jgi:hypothetical protein
LASNGPESNEFDGGSSVTGTGGQILFGGSSSDELSPSTNPQVGLIQPLENLAKSSLRFKRVGITLSKSQVPLKFKFNNGAFKIIKGAKDIAVFNVSDFFEPVPSYGGLMKQEVDVSPFDTYLLNAGNFVHPGGQVNFIMFKCTYSIQAEEYEKVLSWTYKGDTYPMGKLMILSGATKELTPWNGWDLNPYKEDNVPDTGTSVFPGISQPFYQEGGILITNPTQWSINLKIIIAA